MAWTAGDSAFDALGDLTRRRVFRLLSGGELSVRDIAAELPVSRPAVSQHLRVLKDAGLVRDRAVGTRRLYSIDRSGVAALRAEVERLWDDALEAFAEAADRDAERVERAEAPGLGSPPRRRNG